MLRAAAGLALGVSLALAGCGGDEDVSGPATLTPAGAPIYFEAVVKPGEDDRAALDATLGTLLDEDDPVTAIDRALDELFADEGFSWSEDVAPWAGERAGIFTLGLADDSPSVVIVEVEDEALAERELERVVAERAVGPDDSDHLAQAIVEGHALLGPEPGVQAAVDAATEDSLADSEEFVAATEGLLTDRLATLYVAPEPTLDGLREAGEIDAAERDRIGAALGPVAEAPAVLALDATEGALVAELAGSGEGPVATASELFDRAPEDAWLAVGLADVEAIVDATLAAAGPALGDDVASVERDIGLDLTGLAAATGDAAGFLRGTSILGLGGAAILEAAEPGELAAILDRLERGLRGDPAVRVDPLEGEGEGFTLLPRDVPIQFPFALRDDLLVAGLGTAAVEHSFEPDSGLLDSEPYREAAEGLGDELAPVAYIDFERMVELLDGLPGFWSDPDLAGARPYLERLDRLAGGVRADDGRALLRLRLVIQADRPEADDEV